MHAHWLQHVPFEGPGAIAPWLESAGYTLGCTRLDLGEPLPAPEAPDFVVIMGGPMSVNDEATYPWLAAEKAFVHEVIQGGTPVLGVCLGAQLIAAAMGGRVYPGTEPEIGWFPVHGVAPATPDVLALPATFEVFHWHGETFSLPPGAVRLASSEACATQAFQLGRHVIGLQFHLETTPTSAQALVENCRDALHPPRRFVQAEADILAAPEARYREAHWLLSKVLAFLLGTTERARP